MKCENCRIEEAKNMFVGTKRVCERCYYKLRNKTDKINAWDWLKAK